MNVKITFFGELKKFETNIDYSKIKTIDDIVSQISHLEIEPMNFIVSKNNSICKLEAKLNDGDDIRFYPMIMGG